MTLLSTMTRCATPSASTRTPQPQRSVRFCLTSTVRAPALTAMPAVRKPTALLPTMW